MTTMREKLNDVRAIFVAGEVTSAERVTKFTLDYIASLDDRLTALEQGKASEKAPTRIVGRPDDIGWREDLQIHIDLACDPDTLEGQGHNQLARAASALLERHDALEAQLAEMTKARNAPYADDATPEEKNATMDAWRNYFVEAYRAAFPETHQTGGWKDLIARIGELTADRKQLSDAQQALRGAETRCWQAGYEAAREQAVRECAQQAEEWDGSVNLYYESATKDCATRIRAMQPEKPAPAPQDAATVAAVRAAMEQGSREGEALRAQTREGVVQALRDTGPIAAPAQPEPPAWLKVGAKVRLRGYPEIHEIANVGFDGKAWFAGFTDVSGGFAANLEPLPTAPPAPEAPKVVLGKCKRLEMFHEPGHERNPPLAFHECDDWTPLPESK